MGTLVRLESTQTEPNVAVATGRLSRADYGFVAVVVGASVLSSFLLTLFAFGPVRMFLIPSIAIPATVATPASFYLVHQRAKIHALNQQLEDLLRRDPLTGVLTRRYFLSAVQEAAVLGGALLVIDLDDFKSVNDTWGHPAGDRVLSEIAARIAYEAGPSVRVGRLGGEEFAAFASAVDRDGAYDLAERLRRAVSARPIAFDGGSIFCTISLGLEIAPVGTVDLDPIMRKADKALYQAKRAGRDRVCVAQPREVRA